MFKKKGLSHTPHVKDYERCSGAQAYDDIG